MTSRALRRKLVRQGQNAARDGIQHVHPRTLKSKRNLQDDDLSAQLLGWVREQMLQKERMQKLVDTVMESQRFFEDYSRQKEKDAEEYREKDPPPVFNKRLYISTGSVVITNEARRIMTGNSLPRPNNTSESLTKTELMVMRSVVDGLKLVHKGHDYIKDALSHVITFEMHAPHQYIVKRQHEECLSCYFIVQGAVEVTYDMKMAETRSVYQPNIIYNHGTGEFLGLVSAEGLSEDLSPPASIYTKEKCEFLRIDREKFHRIVSKYAQAFDDQKRAFMSLTHCVLSHMPEDAKEKILDKIYKQEFPPNRQIILQGDSSDFLHFVYSGRCKLYRDIYIPAADKNSKFLLRSCEEGSYFGEECIVDREGSYCTVTTSTHTVLFKLHKSAFEVVSKEHLHHLIHKHRHEYPDEKELRERGYTLHTWNDYKHNAVKTCLEERGHLHYMCARDPRKVRARPLTACERNKENMYRFMEKGGQYEPVRMHQISAKASPSGSRVRPRTAIGLRHSTPMSSRSADSRDKEIIDDDDDVVEDDDDTDSDVGVELSGSITQMPSDMARLLAKHVGKNMPKEKIQQLLREGDCRELLKLLDESSEVGRQLRMALEAPSSQEGFTKTTVLMTMKTDDIVRKAKELAESKTDKHENNDDDDGQEWNTVLHEENKSAKIQIAADKFRVAHLRRKMRALERKRESLRLKREQTTEPPQPQPKRFYLHQVQPEQQRLNSDEAKAKTKLDACLTEYHAQSTSRQHRLSSDNTLQIASSQRRMEVKERDDKINSKRPISAPISMMTDGSKFSIPTRGQGSQDHQSDLKLERSTRKGRQSSLVRDKLKTPVAASKVSSSTQTTPRHARDRRYSKFRS